MGRLSADVYRAAPVKAWIVHIDGTVNDTMVVFPWKGAAQRKKKFQYFKKNVIDAYRGTPIREVQFFDKEFVSRELLGGYKDGAYYGGADFLNEKKK